MTNSTMLRHLLLWNPEFTFSAFEKAWLVEEISYGFIYNDFVVGV